MRHLIVLLSAGTLALAQPPAARTVAAPPYSEGSNLPLEKIGRDDLVGIAVYGEPELTRTVRVGSDGTIRLPMLSKHIQAAGLFPADLENAIAEELEAEEIFNNPVVTVSVVEYRSRPINVVGAVKTPLTFQASGTVTLLDAISRAGGLTEFAGTEILLSHTQPGDNGRPVLLTQRIPMKGLIDGADPELNVLLTGGEQIRVPDAGKVYVVGNVKKPGAFLIRDSTESTVLKAMALSEGLLPYAQKMAYIYRQEGGTGGKNEIPIELDKIMQRKSPDVPLLANDILYIPDNKNRRGFAVAMEKALMITGVLGAAGVYAATR